METEAHVEQRRSYERIYETSGLRDEAQGYRWILRLLRPMPAWRILDVACGEGGLLAQACTMSMDAWGLDLSAAALARAATGAPTARVVQGNAESLPFASRSFDAVICLGSLENMLEPTKALEEIHRVLKPEGRLCAMMPNKYWLGDVIQVGMGRDEQEPFQHVERVASPWQWRRFLQLHGFTVARTHGYVKVSPLVRAGKVRSLRKFLVTHLVRLVCPAPLAWSVVFICQKVSPNSGSDRVVVPWLWKAERFVSEASR